MTGIDTGFELFLREHHPDLTDIKNNEYEDTFTSPWATDLEKEREHKSLLKSVGEALKGE